MAEHRDTVAGFAGTLWLWNIVYSRFNRWARQGVWEKVFTALIEQYIADESTLMLDSTTIKVYQHGSSKKGPTKLPVGA